MSDENSAISVTLKAGAGYEAPWVVVRGDSPDQVNTRLEALGQAGVLATAAKVAAELQGAYSATSGLGATPTRVEGSQQQATWQAPQQQAPSAPAPSAPAPQGQGAPAPSCQHGTMTARSGNKNGRAWTGFFCPTPKGTPGQCDPIFGRG